MLTAEETIKISKKFAERLTFFQDNVEDGEQRTMLLLNELGVDHNGFHATCDAMLEFYVGVPIGLLHMVMPGTIAAVQAALSIGIMIGKEVEKESHIREEGV